MFGIAFLLMNVQVTEQQKEIPCKGFDDCMEIAKRYGIDKTAVICETEKGIKKCKVIVTSG
ncbi:MAG: hypothetical protein DRN09_02455 [Thermoplasmata archaeon]|nr:MAG: hypothetical protein DRP23_01060 [Thermotogota bacterium]RLF44947.1 MAG: hypothetical protein DRN09_02455 [Thermoplasmata archaeon]